MESVRVWRSGSTRHQEQPGRIGAFHAPRGDYQIVLRRASPKSPRQPEAEGKIHCLPVFRRERAISPEGDDCCCALPWSQHIHLQKVGRGHFLSEV